MDYDKFQQFGQMNLTPDILIVPSELRYFIKVNKSCFFFDAFIPCQIKGYFNSDWKTNLAFFLRM